MSDKDEGGTVEIPAGFLGETLFDLLGPFSQADTQCKLLTVMGNLKD